MSTVRLVTYLGLAAAGAGGTLFLTWPSRGNVRASCVRGYRTNGA